MSGRKLKLFGGLMKVPERELMGDVLLRETTEPSLPVHVNIGKLLRTEDGQYIDMEDRDDAAKKRQLANAKERLRVSEPAFKGQKIRLFRTEREDSTLYTSRLLFFVISFTSSSSSIINL
ncbi:factor in the germline alpha [Tachysurus ichikawai]